MASRPTIRVTCVRFSRMVLVADGVVPVGNAAALSTGGVHAALRRASFFSSRSGSGALRARSRASRRTARGPVADSFPHSGRFARHGARAAARSRRSHGSGGSSRIGSRAAKASLALAGADRFRHLGLQNLLQRCPNHRSNERIVARQQPFHIDGSVLPFRPVMVCAPSDQQRWRRTSPAYPYLRRMAT